MREALEELRDVQNGPPLVAWEADWNKAINKVAAVLALVPSELAGKVLVDAKDVRELKDLRWLANQRRPFQEWAQEYLDGGRWAGHHYGDAVKTELLERDAQLAEARAELSLAKAKISELEKAK
jgi:hypothetical protein